MFSSQTRTKTCCNMRDTYGEEQERGLTPIRLNIRCSIECHQYIQALVRGLMAEMANNVCNCKV